MANLFRVKISTPKKVCVDKDVVCVTLPSTNGYLGILHDHAKIVSSLVPGYIYIDYADGKRETALINYGLFYFIENKLIILTDFFEYSCHGINVSALDSIRERIEQETKKVQLSEKAIYALNSYMKVVSAKAKQTKK